MTTLVLGSPPPELAVLLERRRLAGVDRLDEVWQGVLHVVSGPSCEHARLTHQLAVLLDAPARAAGLVPAMGDFASGHLARAARRRVSACRAQPPDRVPSDRSRRPARLAVRREPAAI